jgi:hypothetical protein
MPPGLCVTPAPLPPLLPPPLLPLPLLPLLPGGPKPLLPALLPKPPPAATPACLLLLLLPRTPPELPRPAAAPAAAAAAAAGWLAVLPHVLLRASKTLPLLAAAHSDETKQAPQLATRQARHMHFRAKPGN